MAVAALAAAGMVSAVAPGLPQESPLGDIVEPTIDAAFSPGAVFVPEAHPWFDWTTVGGRAYRRFRSRLPAAARVPAVGVLDVTPAGVRAQRIVLREPLRGLTRGRPPVMAAR